MPNTEKDNSILPSITLSSLIISAIGLALSLTINLALRSRSSVEGLGSRQPSPFSGLSVDIPKVHYADGQVFVSVRDPDDWREIREFVQPSNPQIVSTVNRVLYG